MPRLPICTLSDLYSPCGSDEVRLKVAYSGICGSDIHEFLGGPIFPPKHGECKRFTGVTLPVTLGHEFSGTIIEVGAGVDTLATGQPVAVNPALDHRHYKASLCGMCSRGTYNTCDALTTYGLSAPGGGFSDEIVVKAANCFVLPDGVSLKAGALVEPLAVAHHCVQASGFEPGQSVLVCGAGPIGLALLIVLRVLGASQVIMTEVTESRMAQARKFGADTVINPLQGGGGDAAPDPVASAVRRTAGEGVDVSFDATGMQSTLDLCIRATRAGGTIFNVAIHERPLQINLNDLATTEKHLTGGICYTHRDFEAVLRILADAKVDAEQMITSIVPLSNIIDGGFRELIDNKAAHVKILIQPGRQLLN